jgi:outer membrane protein insertion porin family
MRTEGRHPDIVARRSRWLSAPSPALRRRAGEGESGAPTLGLRAAARARRKTACLCLVALALVLTRASGQAQSRADELLGLPVVAIEFECAAPIDIHGLTVLMPMKIGEPLRAEDLREARWRLEQTRLFTSIDVAPQPRARGVAVLVRVERKPIVNRIRFKGNDEISDNQLRRVVPLRESVVLTEELREYSVERIRAKYASEGFNAARVSVELRPRAPGEVDVIFHIEEGVPLRVVAIVIAGQLPVQQEEIRKAIKIRVGERYRREEERAADKAVLQLLRERHFYEAEVNSKWEPAPDGSGTLRFSVDPGPLFDLSFSGNHQLSDRQLLNLIDLPKRPIVTDGTWRELARRARQAYQEKGYYFAKIEVGIEPGPPKLVRFSIDEGRIFHVAKVDFKDNHGLSARQLRAVMVTRRPSWIPWRRGVLLDNVLDDDMKRLWYLYRRHGFEAAEIVDDRVRFDTERGQIFLTVVVDEGRQTIVRHIERSGLAPVAEQLPALAVKVGEPLDREKVDHDRGQLLSALAAAGYTKAKVQSHVSTEPSGAIEAATVSFEAIPGVRQRVGTIIVQNSFDTRASVITRELPFKEGDPLDPQALLKGQTNVYKLGIFRSVMVRPLRTETQPEAVPAPTPAGGLGLPESAGGVIVAPLSSPSPEPEPEAKPNHQDVAVEVADKPPGSLQWGAGYNTRDGFRGFLEVSNDNLQGSARRLSLRGDFSLEPGDLTPNEYLGNLGFREPRVDGTEWTFRSNLIGQRSTRSVDQFSIERFAFIPALERTLRPGLQVGAETQIEQAQIFDLDADVANFNPRDQGRLRTVSVGPFAVYDGRDDPFVPHRGVFDSLRLGVAPSQFGSDIPLIKIFAQHTQYVPLADDLTFVYVLRGGWAHAYKNHDIVPIRDRFFIGGRQTVRGFAENSIGPTGTSDDPLGGDLVMNANTELRFPLLFGFGGVVFVDGGGVYLEDTTGAPGSCLGCDSVSLHDFRRAAGLGLRYITPVGPISLDYGFKLDRRAGESVGEVHFAVGTVF